MHMLLPLASLLGLEVDQLADRLKRHAIAWGAVGFFVLIGLVYLLVALNAAVSLWLGPILGPLALAGGALLFAAALALGMKAATAIGERRRADKKRTAERTALVTSAAVTALPMLPMLIKSPLVRQLGLPLGGAIAALYLLSRPGGSRED